MKIGTKSLLFGAHYPPHVLNVILAWRLIYGTWPSLKEAAAILIHDVGYLGAPELDGPVGMRHPERGMKIARAVLGEAAADLVAGHSAAFASWASVPLSRMYAPDKLAVAFEPAPWYVFRTRATGELAMYRSTTHAATPRPDDPAVSDLDWFRITRFRMIQAALNHALETSTPAGLKERKPEGATVQIPLDKALTMLEAVQVAVNYTTGVSGRPVERWRKVRDELMDLTGTDDPDGVEHADTP